MSEPADVARIRQFADGMPGGLKELVEQFITFTAETFKELRAAADAAEVSRVQMLAHRAAGTAGVCGANQLMALLRDVEIHAKNKAVEQFADGVARIEVELARVHAFLAELLANERSRS